MVSNGLTVYFAACGLMLMDTSISLLDPIFAVNPMSSQRAVFLTLIELGKSS